jgi:uncharacterized protein YcgI (DUF1989 family)
MLMMKQPGPATRPAPETEILVPHGTAGTVAIRQGQLLTVTDVEGGRSAALFAMTTADRREFLSPHHTRVFSNSYVLGLGMRLVTNRRRPILVLGRDDVRAHDLLLPASTDETLAVAGLRGQTGCREAALAAFQAAGIDVPKLPDPVNLFLNVTIRQDGSLVPGPSRSGPGCSVTCRVLIDADVVVAACAIDLPTSQGTGSIEVRVRNEL